MSAVTPDTATIPVPAWMNPEYDYTVRYIDGEWVVVPF